MVIKPGILGGEKHTLRPKSACVWTYICGMDMCGVTTDEGENNGGEQMVGALF
jgi:hypothetical protein